MIQFDKTQEINTNPRHDFGGGVVLRQVRGTSFEQLTPFGERVGYVVAEEIEYEPSLVAQYIRSRAIRQ